MDRRPDGFGAAGVKLWKSISGSYQLRADEVRVLEDACRLADVVRQLEKAMVGQQLLVKGSMGQPVLNPLLAEQKTHRMALAAALKQLKLPDADGVRPNQQREAVQTRWAQAHGKSV